MPNEEEQSGGGMPPGVKPGHGRQPGAEEGGAADNSDGMSLEQALTELEQARKALKAVNSESAGRRKRLDELESAEQARERAKLSEVEQATKDRDAAAAKLKDAEERATAMEKAHRESIIRYEVQLAALTMGIVDPDAAVKLMDWEKIVFADDGKPKNVDAVLKALVGAKPYLAKATSGSSGLGTPPGKQKSQQPADGDREAFEALVRRQIIR
jgi:hypothetical protein